MPHLRGIDWKKSERALNKKERAKEKHFSGTDTAPVDYEVIKTTGHEIIGLIVEIKTEFAIVLHEDRYLSLKPSSRLDVSFLNTMVPGDKVVLVKENGESKIGGIVSRDTVLSRMRRDSTRRTQYENVDEQIIAANIDIAVIVASAQAPAFHPKFVDRYLILIQHNGILPVVCLNKCELATPKELEVLASYEDLGIKTIAVSAMVGSGISELKKMLLGKTAVLVGHSGVGKSSLINAIDPSANLKTGQISEHWGKGKHTTTSSLLHRWNDGSHIIDTPGIRSLEIWNVDKTELQLYYPEFLEFAKNCKYSDCLHHSEPDQDCGVKNAVLEGRITKERYESYIKILGEL